MSEDTVAESRIETLERSIKAYQVEIHELQKKLFKVTILSPYKKYKFSTNSPLVCFRCQMKRHSFVVYRSSCICTYCDKK